MRYNNRMPIYEYVCESCLEAAHEIHKPVREMDTPEACPTCNGLMTRLISKTSFQLKGGGWFRDGYSSSSSASKPTQYSNNFTYKKKPS